MATRFPLFFSFLAAVSILSACQQTEITQMDCPGFNNEKDQAANDVVPDVPSDDADDAGEVAQGPKPTGAACTTDEECETKSCFTREFLSEVATGFGVEWNYDIPGGMCSMLFCDPEKTTQCGDNGFCFDVAPLFGAEGMVIGLCLAACEDYSDCRYTEGYVCYFTGTDGETKACLPSGIVIDIPCGDGKCDEATEDSTSCPRDCR